MNGEAAHLSKQKRNYPLLLASQFLSAFGDNLILMIILGPFLIERNKGMITEQQQSVANIYYTSLLFVPYVLFRAVRGLLERSIFQEPRIDERQSFQTHRCRAVTAPAGIGANKTWLAAGYFIVGIGACVYSPAKYGILPEILPTERLVKANGLLELLTLVAILTGNIGGAMAFDRLTLSACYSITMAIYALSLALNLVMTRTPSYGEVRFAGSTGAFFRNVGNLFSQKRLARVLVGTALFWVCGAVLKMNFQPWGQRVLNLQTMTAISLLGLWLSIGVMAGSILAGQLYMPSEICGRRGDTAGCSRVEFLLSGV